MDTVNNTSEDAGQGKFRPSRKSGTRRHSPYARPNTLLCRSESLAERALGIYRQISKPLFGRSLLRSYSDDAFSVPWRTVDRETAELREQLYEAQRRAALVDERRLAEEARLEEQRGLAEAQEKIKADAESKARAEAEAEAEAKTETDAEAKAEAGAEAKADAQSPIGLQAAEKQDPLAETSVPEQRAPETVGAQEAIADAFSAEQKPKYESIFQTARRLAQERVLGVPIPTALQPNPYIVSSTTSKQKPGSKGKELDLGSVPKLAASVSAHEAIIRAASAGSENENSDDDKDFEPNTSDDDDEEEILQESMEPIDELEEVTTSAGDVDSPAAFSETNEDSAQQDAEEDQSIEVSVVEESDSDAVADSRRALDAEEAESVGSEAYEQEAAVVHAADSQDHSVEDGDEDEDNDVEDEFDGNESDQVTVEIASMGSDDESNEIDEREHEHEAALRKNAGVPHLSHSQQLSSPSRSWWPFSARALFGEKSESPPVPEKREEEDLGADRENISVDLNSDASHQSTSPKSAVAVGVQTPPSPAYSRPFAPLSFIDISASGKRFSRIRGSRRHASELSHALSRPLESSLPLPQQQKQDATEQKDKKSDDARKPLITAQSLGIESKRSSKQSEAQKPRKRPMLYYGAGYGSRSVPYTINLSRSAPSGPVFAKEPEKTQQSSTESQKKGSSITAQKILDIIGEVAPPARSHSTADLQDVINPYELSSPYSVRMRPKTVQKRRVLVPLSARLAQASAPQASPAKQQRADAAAASAKLLMQSIQSAAPPEIKAVMESAQKPVARELPKTEISSKKVESKGETKAIKVQSLFANAPETPAAFKPSSSLLAPASASKSSLSKHEIGETSKPATGQLSLATESATPVRTPRATALALGEAQLPKYAFDLPVAKLGSSATADSVKRTVVSLSASQLPVFAFSIETSAAPFLSELASKPSLKADAGSKTATSSWADSGFKMPGLKDGEWKCGVCDIANPKGVNQCRACESPKPNSNPSSQPAPAKPSATSSWADSGFKMPGLKDGEWKCGVCDITNPKNVSQCRACESPKPAPKPSAPQPVPAQAPAASSWADSGFKMPGLKDGEWKCGVCDIANPKGVNQCRACESPKPSSSQSTPAQVPVASSWTDSGFKMPGLKDGEWKCGVCDITNPKNVNQCRACESPKPASASANALPSSSAAAKTNAGLPPSDSAKLKASSLATDQLPTFTFELDVAKKPTAPAAAPNLWAESGFKVPALKDGEWKCTLCMITNPASSSACRACETPK